MASVKDNSQNKFAKEGVDHINVSVFANTSAGVTTSLDLRRSFTIPHLGSFGSPRCFANYIGTMGDDQYRHHLLTSKVGNLTGRQYRAMTYFAKYYQLTSNPRALDEVRRAMRLPWTSYRAYLSGVREYDLKNDYPVFAKALCQHLFEYGTKTPFNWELVMARFGDFLDERITAIARSSDPSAAEVSFMRLTCVEESVRSEEDSPSTVDEQTPAVTREEPVSESVANSATHSPATQED